MISDLASDKLNFIVNINLTESIRTCVHCSLSNNLPKVVVSRGSPDASLMLIGEAPGALEDEFGEPFVGRSGQLLDSLLNSVGISPTHDVFICNVLKCRPPNNRKPTKFEIEQNLPWLEQQIRLVDPSIICLLGATAVDVLLGIKGSLSTHRGHWHDIDGRLVMPLFHPAYLLRNPSKDPGKPFSLTKNDLLKVKDKLSTFRI